MLILEFKEKDKNSLLVQLPASKSISNRVLLISKLCKKQPNEIINLSNSSDTQILKNALFFYNEPINFKDAGTPLRFFIAYSAILGCEDTIICDNQLAKRPHKDLFTCLENLGAEFQFLNHKYEPPFKLIKKTSAIKNVEINNEKSSQFISALCITLSSLNQSINIFFTDVNNSSSYINLTVNILNQFGKNININKNTIHIDSNPLQWNKTFNAIENDWGAATFILMLNCAVKKEIILENLSLNSTQPDSSAAHFFAKIGIVLMRKNNDVLCHFLKNYLHQNETITFDFKNCIDLVPAAVCACAFFNYKILFTGITNLQFKESNRIESLAKNLFQFGIKLVHKNETLQLEYFNNNTNTFYINTFNDHRIAMALSIFSYKYPVEYSETESVQKSFPNFWTEIKKLGFNLQ